LIEPTPVLRQSLRSWLEANFAPCAILEAENISAALEISPEENPRVILLDLDMLSEAEWISVPQLARRFPQAEMIGMGLDDTPQHRQRAESAGITVFVSKSQLHNELASTLLAKLNDTRGNSMTLKNYVIRTMSRAEVNLAVDWAAAEGWNPGLYDADCFYAADLRGFLVGELDGEPIASISVVKYGGAFGFLGFYIVKPEHRGKGYGIQIWKEGMKYLSGRNIGLDGVLAQQENYKKSGFKLAYRNIRYEGISGGETIKYPNIVSLSQITFDMLAQYDQKFFPDDRKKFLKAWVSQSGSITLGALSDEKLSGYGMIRACRAGYKIGPLFADTPEYAEAIFNSLKSSVAPGMPIYLDVPEVNLAALALTEKYGMKLVFETARMYTGDFPDLPLNKIFGVTTFELG
jgi:CheY-like chemotaxis protein